MKIIDKSSLRLQNLKLEAKCLRCFLKLIWLISLLMLINPNHLLGGNRHLLPYLFPQERMPREASRQNETETWVTLPIYQQTIAKHNRYLVEFGDWRKKFCRHAGDLAQLLKMLPGTGWLEEAHLRKIFSCPERYSHRQTGEDIFAPWRNRWFGVWSNGKPQFHIWKSTSRVNGQWIQPVSLSESGFVEFSGAERLTQRKQADIAINVFSAEYGITGWVSKFQHGRLEVPHIGYSINDTTLVWICQIKEPERLLEADSCWIVFLETVDRSVSPAAYHIQGQAVTLTDSGLVATGPENPHLGTYYAMPEL